MPIRRRRIARSAMRWSCNMRAGPRTRDFRLPEADRIPISEGAYFQINRRPGRSPSPPRRGEDLALADVVGGADDAFGLHALDDAGGAVVADLQVALHKARRGLALAADDRDRLVVERVARAVLLAAGGAVEAAVVVLG